MCMMTGEWRWSGNLVKILQSSSSIYYNEKKIRFIEIVHVEGIGGICKK